MRSKALALVLAFALLGGRPAPTVDGFTSAGVPYAFHFPRDQYAHDAYRTEWWYFTGHLSDARGRRFGYELTIFRFGLEPHAGRRGSAQSAWRAAQLYPAHFAITDERGGRFVYSETLARDALGQGSASEGRLDVRANGWSLTGLNADTQTMRLHARDGANAVDVEVASSKPPAVHGVNGVSKKAACASCASHYYSFTRLRTTGTLVFGGMPFRVTGLTWMDHEFGSGELSPTQVGWDWFSIQLDDDREIMLYRMRERDGSETPQSSGSVIERDGRVRHVTLPGVDVSATGTWMSPHTGAVYPSGWEVHVKGIAASLRLTPVLLDQELVGNGTTPTYWEGAVDVRDARSGARLGVGYVELTGYAGRVTL